MDILNINSASEETIRESFETIASNLISGTKLVINNCRFSFIDIEFYYSTQQHIDEYAISIEHCRPKGEFEVHKYGVDISLGNSAEEKGGVLIRGLYDEVKKKVIPKAQVIRTIYNQFNLGENHFALIQEKTQWSDIFKSKRMHLGKAEGESKERYADTFYRYLAKDKGIFKSYPDKELILKNSNLSDKEIVDLIGYKLRK